MIRKVVARAAGIACAVVAFLLLGNCSVSAEREAEIKRIVFDKYPDFESEVKVLIKNKYGANVFKRSRWEWNIQEAPRNHEYKVKYGCFRDLNFAEILYGELTQDITSELSLGLVSYNPKSKGKGIYVMMIVHTERRSVIFGKR